MKEKAAYTLVIFILLSLIPSNPTLTENVQAGENQNLGYVQMETAWVSRKLEQMSLEEKVGQLFMVAAYSNQGDSHTEELRKLINDYHIGGLIFFQGTAERQLMMTNQFQEESKIPLLIGMDAEWGLSMRLQQTMDFPRQMALGAIQHDSLIYEMGKEIGRQLRSIGVHVNFAPVVDVNNNPDNPVIHMRSFGEDKYRVAEKGIQYSRGLQDAGVLAVAKHFPGHGDTDVDSHHDLPVINHSKERLDTLELYPFRKLFAAGVGGVMTAHLNIPSYEPDPKTASSLSPAISSELMRKQMHYDGLVFTDALNMKGVTKFFKPGEVEIKALLAGNDVLLFPENVPVAQRRIIEAIEEGIIDETLIDERVTRILRAKEWVGLNNYRGSSAAGLNERLHQTSARMLRRNLVESSLTLVNNESDLVPLKRLTSNRIASLAIGADQGNMFQRRLNDYGVVSNYQLPLTASQAGLRAMKAKLAEYDVVITSVHSMSMFNTRTFGINQNIRQFINELEQDDSHTQLVVLFGSPYSLKLFESFGHILVAYQEDSDFMDLSAQLIFGGISPKGKLPVQVGSYALHQSASAFEPVRLKYSMPEEFGVSYAELDKRIREHVEKAIKDKATPGAQVLVAKKGKIIYQESFGCHTYDCEHKVAYDDIYDVASITKIAATTLASMRFHDLGILNLDSTVGYYLPDVNKSDKGRLRIRELMTHQAGLEAWIPFYRMTITKDGLCDESYCYEPNNFFANRVAEGLYINTDYTDEIWQTVYESPLREPGKMVYSDIGMFFMKRILENLTRDHFDHFVELEFYRPMGMNSTAFLPREKFSMDRIVPTERDTYFRMQLLHGDVHDPAAAMLGGVAGHAGLFSNSGDLAKYMQMLLNEGIYGGERYVMPETVRYFTSKQFEDNRRGLGFDKPETDPDKGSPVAKIVPASAFGHLGFTGTAVWADPEHEIIYVFLSNRVYPTQNNRKLIQNSTRSEIHKAIYQLLVKPEVSMKKP